ncbi:transcriptional regulator [Rhodosporidiobolus nylandii]
MHTAGAQLAHGQSEASLDPSDFPALGSGPAAGATPSTAAASLFSSYASQAGQSSIGAAGAGANGLPAALAALGGAAPSLTADDFPALGGGVGAIGAQADVASLAGAVNGLSLAGRSVQTPGQEQASALAALQAQQHRANLLGSMNGQRTASGAEGSEAKLAGAKQAPSSQQQSTWSGSPPQINPNLAAGLLPNGTPAPASSASSPLPPSSTLSNAAPPSSSDSQQPPSQQQPQLRSPNAPPSAGVNAVNALLAAAAAGAAVGGPSAGPGASAGAGAAPGAQLSANNPLGSLPPPTAGVTTGAVPQTPAQQVLFSPADRFGLLGLLHTIKTSDPDLSMLALGNDLTNLGLDLGATDNLYSSFITPWSDSKAAAMLNIEPEFHLPSCYNVQPPPANTKIGNFSDETLFFIFYSQPRDAMQEMAAHELYKHNWRYHKELRLWLTKEAGTEPIQKTATFERGSYIFFDPVLWERVRKEFILHFESLETRRA